jgi:hypothetical protein
MTSTHWVAAALAACLTLTVAAAGAQAPTATPGKPIPNVVVKLAEHRQMFEHGKAAFYHGVADEDGVAFLIPGLTINTAAALVLESSDPGARMTLRLKNDFSPGWDRTLETGDRGVVDTRFRTEGPAIALVSSDGGMKPYRLVVWAGTEVKPHTAASPPFVTQAEYDRQQGGGWMGTGLAIGAVLVLLAVGAALLLRRRSRS